MKPLINIIGFHFLLAIALQLQAQQTIGPSSSKSLTQKLDDYLISLFRAQRFNGTVLIAQKGKIILQKSYGWKNISRQTLNDTNCIFQIASISKTFTSSIILKLQELGKLSVKDKLEKYLPDFPNGKKITIENLLTHTSGIGNIDVDDTDTITWSPVGKTEILNAFKNEPLEFKPVPSSAIETPGTLLECYEKITASHIRRWFDK